MTASPPARLRLGMVGGGRGGFIGEAHRIAARLDDRYELVAGALSADPQRAIESGRDLRLGHIVNHRNPKNAGALARRGEGLNRRLARAGPKFGAISRSAHSRLAETKEKDHFALSRREAPL
jgi:hypothetical protein